MAMFTSTSAKRQKTVSTLRDSTTRSNIPETNEFFPGISKIEYKPDASVDDTLSYRYYNPSEKVHGRPMEEWLRPSISFWQAFHFTDLHAHGFGWNEPSFIRSWDDGSQTIDGYKRRLKAAFEFYNKLGVKYWCVWDRDLAPEGDTLEETNHNLDECVEFVSDLQHRSGIRPLWVAANLHYNPRYNNGALTTSEAQVISYAGAQIKKALDVAHKLGAENFLFRGIKEGYSSSLNTDHSRQLRNYARLLKMASDYKERLGFRGQLLFEPNYEDFSCYKNEGFYNKDRQTLLHYDYDTTSTICFLKHYGLDRQFKISTKPGHQLTLASLYGMLGSVDLTFYASPPHLTDATLLMKSIIDHGGIQPGGLNIGVKLRPDSVDLRDLVVSYVAIIDVFAHALRIASKIISDGVFTKHLQQRYLSFHSGFGSRFMNGEASLDECEEHTRKLNGEISHSSGHSEHLEAMFAHYTSSKV